MKQLLLLITILILSTSLSAQQEETVFGYSGLKLTGAWGGPVFGLTSINDENAYYRGGFGGLEFSKSFYLGYAAYWIEEDIEFSQFESQDFDFRYNGAMLGYAFRPEKMVHPKIMVVAAGGRVDFENEKLDRVFVLQPAGGIEVNVFKWWHIDLMGGYRVVTGTNLEGLSDSDLSAPFGEIKLRFGISWGW